MKYDVLLGRRAITKIHAIMLILIVLIALFIIRPPVIFPPPEVKLDLRVAPPSLAPAPVDLDGDGIGNVDERMYGLNPNNPDSDGDGVPDGVESKWNLDVDGDGHINALDPDSDDDGLPDGTEDLNCNGVVDDGETDPLSPDTDRDGLFDGTEDRNRNGRAELNETSPLIPDSDDDGLVDSAEPYWSLDSDGDGFINALDPDSDDDDLKDGDEVAIYGTDPLDQDTDDDHVTDHTEILKKLDPNNPDTDRDWLIDGMEATENAWWVEAERFAYEKEQIVNDTGAVGGKALVSRPDGSLFSAKPFNKTSKGAYKLYIRAKYGLEFLPFNLSFNKPEIHIQIMGGGVTFIDTHPMPTVYNTTFVRGPPPFFFILRFDVLRNIYRWYSTPTFTLKHDNEIAVEISCPKGYSIYVDRLMLVRMGNINVPLTDPLNPDTDGDGILDGVERVVKSYWWEAEDFAYMKGQIMEYADASNGKEIAPLPLPRKHRLLCEISDESYIYPSGPYTLYIRARHDDPDPTWSRLNVSVTIEYEKYTERLFGNIDVWGLYKRGNWYLVYYGSLVNTTFWLEEPARINITIFQPLGEPVVFVDKVSLIQVRYKIDPISIDYSPLPRALDPMDPDTDGDQLRFRSGAIKESAGYLTDGFENEIGTNPFDLDTDQDSLLNMTLSTDDVDFNPLSWDSDGDGLFDWIEDRDLDGQYDQDFETDPLNPDTDYDGYLDGTEDWNYNGVKETYESDPRDPDTDDDGLLDGWLYTAQRLGRDFTVNEGSPQYNFYMKHLPTLTDKEGNKVFPYIENRNGTVTFIGEHHYLYEGRSVTTSPVDRDYDIDGLIEGEELFIYRTDPQDPDTDDDGRSDYVEIFIHDTDPLVPEYPDLSIESVTIFPKELLIQEGMNTTTVRLEVTTRNVGVVDIKTNITITLEGSYYLDYERVEDERVKFGMKAGESWTANLWLNIPMGIHGVSIWVGTEPDVKEMSYDNNFIEVTIVVEGPPTINVEIDRWFDYSGPRPHEVDFRISIEDPDSEKLQYEWSFGDGVVESGSIELPWDDYWKRFCDYISVEHNYTEVGTYDAVFKVWDEDGREAVYRISGIEVLHGLKDDPDADGLTNREEIELRTNKTKADTDDDGLKDGDEVKVWGSDPKRGDSDGDGLVDRYELLVMEWFKLNVSENKGNINNPDSDGDGLKDGEEYRFQGGKQDDPTNPTFWFGTNPYHWDTDFDGLSDYQEVKGLEKPRQYRALEWVAPYNPFYNYKWEKPLDPLSPDTDGDGLSDYDELKIYGTHPTDPDSDDDDVPDGIDLQPLSQPRIGFEDVEYDDYEERFIETQHPYGFGWVNIYMPGLLTFNLTVDAYGIEGAAWSIKPLVGEEQVNGDNIKSSRIDYTKILDYDYGNFVAYTAKPLLDKIYYDYDVWTDNLITKVKVKYRYYYKRYHVDFTNQWGVKADIWYCFWEVSPYKGKDQSIVIQFTIKSEDKTHIGEGMQELTIPAFWYKLYGKKHVKVWGGYEKYYWSMYDKRAGVPATAMHEGISFASTVGKTISGKNVYQVEILIPKDYTHEGNFYLYLSPIWITKESREVETSPLNPGIMDMKAMVRKISISDVEEWIIGVDFDTLRYPIKEISWTETRKKMNEMLLLVREMDGKYYVKEIKVEERVCDASTRAIKTTEWVKEVNLGELEGMLKDKLEIERYRHVIEDFKNAVSEVLGKGVDPSTIYVATAMDLKQGMMASRVSYVDGEIIGSDFFYATKTPGPLLTYREYRPLKVPYSRPKIAKASTLHTVVVTTAECAWYIYNAFLAMEAGDELRAYAYYVAAVGAVTGAIVGAIITGLVTAALKALAIPVAGWIAAVVMLVVAGILMIPAVGEAIDAFARWVCGEIEELKGKVPPELALTAFQGACNKVIDHVNEFNALPEDVRGNRIAIAILPEWG
jgi:hypothetical protein